ncbi:MAG TPA: right-handed parallel beta-helix repeat-containing protein [Phycisphaerales bacterium]|nr:right-handed parallel beta-helix repeat-containing protein [Phycisphaerales bacterium]
MKLTRITICCVFLLTCSFGFAADLRVPGDYATIQAAISVSADGDAIVLSPDTTYSGSGNTRINFMGKAITVRSVDPGDPETVASTVIDGGNRYQVFVFCMGETGTSKVQGVTITGGYGFVGGAISCQKDSSPVFENCVISGNTAVISGGAVYIAHAGSQPVFKNCYITGNTAGNSGGAIYSIGSGGVFENCLITGNSAPRGGGIYAHNISTVVMKNCTVTNNSATTAGGGIYCFTASTITMTNCIIYNNSAPAASDILIADMGPASTVNVFYCNLSGDATKVVVQGNCVLNLGAGNIFDDPMFISDTNLRLQKYSPCVDTGEAEEAIATLTVSVSTDIGGNPRVSGEGIDVGAYEYQAVMTAIIKVTPRTLNLDGKGKHVQCTISFEGDYSPADIDTEELLLNGTIRPLHSKVDARRQYLLVKFDRKQLEEMIDCCAKSADVSVYGKLTNGTEFEGFDKLKIKTAHHHAKHKGHDKCKDARHCKVDDKGHDKCKDEKHCKGHDKGHGKGKDDRHHKGDDKGHGKGEAYCKGK